MNEFTTHGYLTISNHGGFEIAISLDGDDARLKYFDKVSRWQEIKLSMAGESYVTYYGTRYNLDEFMKIQA